MLGLRRRRRWTRIRADVLAHHKLNRGREAAEKALLAALWRDRPAELDLERDDVRRPGQRPVPVFAMFVQRLVADAVSATDGAAPAGRPRDHRAGGRRVCWLRPSRAAECVLPRSHRRPRLDRRRRRAAGRAGAPARAGARPRTPRSSLFLEGGRRVHRGGHHRRAAHPAARGRPVRATARRRTRTSWSTRPRTSPRCSGGCCGGAGRSASWTIVGDPAQSSLARSGRVRAGDHRADRPRVPVAPLPDEHQLPQPGGGVRRWPPRWSRRTFPNRRPARGRPLHRGRARAAGHRARPVDRHRGRAAPSGCSTR